MTIKTFDGWLSFWVEHNEPSKLYCISNSIAVNHSSLLVKIGPEQTVEENLFTTMRVALPDKKSTMPMIEGKIIKCMSHDGCRG